MKCRFPSTHAENVLVRRVGSGLGMRYPLKGDGERSLTLRFSGRWRELGEGGEVGDCCEADEVGSEDIPDAWEKPRERKRSDLAQNGNCHKSHKFFSWRFCKNMTHFLQTYTRTQLHQKLLLCVSEFLSLFIFKSHSFLYAVLGSSTENRLFHN